MYMICEVIDFKTPGMPFELEVQGFVLLSFDLHGTALMGDSSYRLNFDLGKKNEIHHDS